MTLLIILAACALLLGVGSAVAYRLRSGSSREANYRVTQTHWIVAMAGTQRLYGLLANDPDGFVKRLPPFQGLSKSEYETASLTWADWLALRSSAEQLLNESQQLFEQHRQRKWWQLLSFAALQNAHNKLTEGTVVVDPGELSNKGFLRLASFGRASSLPPGSIIDKQRSDSVEVERQFVRFSTAIQAATAAEQAIRQELTGEPGQKPDTLYSFRTTLSNRNLPLTPYETRLNELDTLAEEFYKLVRPDPLSDYSAPQTALRRKIGMLKHDMRKAVDQLANLDALRARFQSCVNRVSEVRSRKVVENAEQPPAVYAWIQCLEKHELPVPAADATIKLAEQEVSPDQYLAEANNLIVQLEQLLFGGRLIKFGRVLNDANQALDASVAAVNKQLSDKKWTDDVMDAIVRESTETDIAVDREEHHAVCGCYLQQRWSLARQAAQVLKGWHDQRQKTRQAADKLNEPLSLLAAKLQQYNAVISAALDAEFVALEQDTRALQQETGVGRTDWNALVARIGNATESLVGSGHGSFLSRLERQVTAHQGTCQALATLRERLDDLQTKLKDGWGGAEAVSGLTTVEPAVAALEARYCSAGNNAWSLKPKQDWRTVTQAIEEVLSALSPVQQLVEQHIALDRSFLEQLQGFETELNACRKETYVRTICGEEFGSGIYCPTQALVQLFEVATDRYQKRQYDQMLQQVTSAREELCQLHLECWWLCLQLMSLSEDPCARQFAWQQGYADGRFEAWVNERRREGALYNPPEIHCARHATRKIKGKKELGDAPPTRDYEGRA